MFIAQHIFEFRRVYFRNRGTADSICSLQDELLSLNQPTENRPTFNICNSSLAHRLLYHMYYKIDQHDSSSCKGTFGLLHFMGQTQ